MAAGRRRLTGASPRAYARHVGSVGEIGGRGRADRRDRRLHGRLDGGPPVAGDRGAGLLPRTGRRSCASVPRDRWRCAAVRVRRARAAPGRPAAGPAHGARAPGGRRRGAVGGHWHRGPDGQSGGADRGRQLGRRGRADGRRRVVGRVGPDVALLLAGAGRQPLGRPVAVPLRVAPPLAGQRGARGQLRRVHVQPVQRHADRSARGRGRAARRVPAQDGRPARAPGARVHVPHAECAQTAGRYVRGYRRPGRVHAVQAHELHAHLQRAHRRTELRLGREHIRSRVQVHRTAG